MKQVWIRHLKKSAHSVIVDLLGETGSDLWGLLFPWRLPPLIKTQRAFLIISRVRLIALMFAVLTPLWIIIDAQLLPRSVGVSLALGRLVTASAFAGLFMMFRKSDRMIDAYVGTVLLFLIPTLFYFYSHQILLNLEIQQEGLAATLVAGYTYLPFVLVAGLAVFPLSAVEGLVFVMPAMALMTFAALARTDTSEWDTQLGMLWLMGMIAGVAILSGMSQLHYLAEIIIKSAHDTLTKAFNRASGSELLEKYFLLAVRNNVHLTVLFFDLDHFKSINDTHGHEAGDTALLDLVCNLSSKLRREDLVIRWGGEEFIVVLPHTDGIDPEYRGKLVERLSRAGLGKRPDGSPLTASVGMAELQHDKAATPAELVERADSRMYRAKSSGRNRICYGDRPGDMTPVGVFTTSA
ncbi:MAG: GGDEF domain-containing protein [Magnetococcus sp. WYHC-3]